jgi:hypothetical protein
MGARGMGNFFEGMRGRLRHDALLRFMMYGVIDA